MVLLSGCSTKSNTTPDNSDIEVSEPKETTVSANGYGGQMSVHVKASSDKIMEVVILEHKESPGISDLAIEEMPNKIIENQSTKVDVVSGATFSSRAIQSAVEKALTEMDIDKEKFSATEDHTITPGENETTDVIIVGGGLSGLIAGVELQRNHPDVKFIILEKLPIFGGSLPATGGAMISTDSKWHIEQDAVATTDDIVEFFKESSQTDEINEQLIRNVYDFAGETFDWMVEFGVPFEEKLEISSPYSSKVYAAWAEGRTLYGGGANFYRAIRDDINELDMDLRLNSDVKELIVENDVVKGVKVEDNKHSYEIRANAVILTTGGFAKNKDMMREYTPELVDGVQDALEGSKGDGFKLIKEHFDTKIVGSGAMGGFLSPNMKRIAQVPFMVNSEAKRFMDETTLYARLQRILAEKADGEMWLITDSKYSGINVVKEQVESGAFKEFNTLEELAAEFGLNPDTLIAEVNAYNEAIENNESPGFNLPVEKAHPIKEAPFYGAHAVVRSFATIPGLEVTDTLNVLDGDGNVIPNLFASGELVVGNVYSYQYPGSGVAISWAANSGRLAGNAAAAHVKGQ